MPCALVESNNYPDYLKSILKKIAVGNDEKLKTCACQLKSPLSQDGCPIVDEDGKIGAFPFCIENNPEEPEPIGTGTLRPIGMTLKQMMRLCWKVKNYKLTSPALQQVGYTEYSDFPVLISKQEDLVCGIPNRRADIGQIIEQPKCKYYTVNKTILEINNASVIKFQDLYYPSIFVASYLQVLSAPKDSERPGGCIDELTELFMICQVSSLKFEETFTKTDIFNIPEIGNIDMYRDLEDEPANKQVNIFGKFAVNYW